MATQFKVSDKMQQVAVDFLEELYFAKTMDEIHNIIGAMEDKYQIESDPFTHMPCTTKEYIANSEEYRRQQEEQLEFMFDD